MPQDESAKIDGMSTDPFHSISGGHSEGPEGFNLAGSLYLIIVIIYTILVVVGCVYLVLARHTVAMRLRGLYLTIGAVLMIHVYSAAVFIVYPLNGSYTCAEEFWYMSIVFPLSIATYQTANARLLSVADRQSNLVTRGSFVKPPQPRSAARRIAKAWFESAAYEKRTGACVLLGILIQFIVTFFVYFGSRRFHSSSGIFGQRSDNGAACRTGPEWIPSVLWQTCFTWIIGPYILLKTRHIHDTHYWALQTRISVLAGLPGTPLWLLFLYAKDNVAIQNVNLWWPPAFWFVPGLVAIQSSMICCAVADMRRNGKVQKCRSTGSADNATRDRAALFALSTVSANDLCGNRTAFETFLDHHIDTLSNFAATRDFTGENVEFLRRTTAFSKEFAGISQPTRRQKQQMYHAAAKIFFEQVDPSTSMTPINIDWTTLKSLKRVFAGLSYQLDIIEEGASGLDLETQPNQTVTAWVGPEQSSLPLHNSPSKIDHDHGGGLWNQWTRSCIQPRTGSVWHVPDDFNVRVFDMARAAIMYLVYTNTWRNFVRRCDQQTITELVASLDEENELEEK